MDQDYNSLGNTVNAHKFSSSSSSSTSNNSNSNDDLNNELSSMNIVDSSGSSSKKKKDTCLCCLKEVEDCSRCSKCRTALYCDRACQEKHWPVHKNICQDSNNAEDSNEKLTMKATNHLLQGK